jgi:hypothetical protein
MKMWKKIREQKHNKNNSQSSCLMDATGSTLKEIVDNLAKIYDKITSIDDYRSEADNFTRKKDETILHAMTRATPLIQKLRPLSTEG